MKMPLRLNLFIHAHHVLALTRKKLLRCHSAKHSLYFSFFILTDKPVNSWKWISFSQSNKFFILLLFLYALFTIHKIISCFKIQKIFGKKNPNQNPTKTDYPGKSPITKKVFFLSLLLTDFALEKMSRCWTVQYWYIGLGHHRAPVFSSFRAKKRCLSHMEIIIPYSFINSNNNF